MRNVVALPEGWGRKGEEAFLRYRRAFAYGALRVDEGSFFTFVQNLYGAVAEPCRWNALAPQLASIFHSGSSIVRLIDRRNGSYYLNSATPNLDANADRIYQQHFQYIDPLFEFVKANRNEAFISHESYPIDKWLGSEIYNDFSSKYGIHHAMGIVLDVDRTRIGIVAIQRESRAKDFSQLELRNFERAVPHFQRAFQLRCQLGQVELERDASLAVLERLDTAAMVVSESGRVLFSNDQAEMLLDGMDALSIRNGLLVADLSKGDVLLQAIGNACSAGRASRPNPGSTIRLQCREGIPLFALVSPFPSSIRAALVVIRDPRKGRAPDPEKIRTALSLTVAEAAVATALCEGEDAEAIALRRKVSVYTVRNQIKAVLAKAGVSRQSELTSLVLRIVNPAP